jgi:hypothetical protein
MPPYMEIYGLTRRRDVQTVNRFIDEYINRELSEGRGDEELFIEPVYSDKTYVDYYSELAHTLTHIVERGLTLEGDAFYVTLRAKDENFIGATLGFTHDDLLIIGVYIEDAMMPPENLPRGKSILRRLMQDYDCHWGIMMAETPPPMSETDFEEWEQHPMTDCVMKRVKDRIEVTYERERKPEEFIG